MLDNTIHLARPADTLQEKDADPPQRPMDALEDVEWLRLIVERVEGRNEVERLELGTLVEAAQIDGNESAVAEAFLCSLIAREGDGVRREIQACEAAARVQFG